MILRGQEDGPPTMFAARYRGQPLEDLVPPIPLALGEPHGSDDACLLGARLNPSHPCA
jgi:hypothetical protein